MALKRMGMLALGLALVVLPTSGSAQEKKGKGDDKERDGLIGRVLHLMPPKFAAELKLTEEQRTQIQKMEQDFNAKRKQTMLGTFGRVMNIVEALESDEKTDEPAPVLALCHEITGALLEARRTRIVYEKKMTNLLTPEQQTKFAQLKERGPFEIASKKGGTTTQHFYGPQGHEKLQLTDQQKQKLSELQREMDNRVRELLTEEQRRQLDEANPPRKGPPAPRKPEREKQD